MSHVVRTGKKIKVREKDVIRLHWFNAAIWVLMLLTGFGIISGDFVRVAPAFWAEFMQGLFGGNAALTLVHAVIGIVWTLVFVVFAALNIRRTWQFFRDAVVITPWGAAKDAWSMVVSLAHLFGARINAPLCGRFNGAQRLLGTMILFGSIALAATGIYMFFAPKFLAFSEMAIYGAIFRWSLVLHIGAVFLVLIGLVAHIYYALVEERESMESMKTGEMSVDFIHYHNPGWYEELKAQGRVD